MVDLGFVITSYQYTDLRVKYPLPGGQGNLNVIYFTSNNKGLAYKDINSLERDLIRFGFSGEIAKTFYKELEIYQTNLSNIKNSICQNLEKLLKDRDNAIMIFDRLIRNF